MESFSSKNTLPIAFVALNYSSKNYKPYRTTSKVSLSVGVLNQVRLDKFVFSEHFSTNHSRIWFS